MKNINPRVKKWVRTLWIGFVVGLIFFCWILYDFYKKNWGFELFSSEHWGYLHDQFFNKGWKIRGTSNWIFILTIVFAVPIFIFLWRWAVNRSWRKSVRAIYHYIKKTTTSSQQVQKKVKVQVQTKKAHHKVRPKPMVSVGRPPVKKSGKTMDAATENALTSTPVPPAEQPPALTEFDDIPLDDIQLPERIALQEDLVSVLSNANYQIVKDVTLENLPLSYIGVSTDKVVLCLTDNEKGDWLADEEFFNDEDPLWFSENAHRGSPVQSLLTAGKSFAKKMKAQGLTQDVIPILIEKEGNIINAEDMAETWKTLGVIVCRTDLGGPDELPSFETALPHAAEKGTAETLDSVRNLF